MIDCLLLDGMRIAVSLPYCSFTEIIHCNTRELLSGTILGFWKWKARFRLWSSLGRRSSPIKVPRSENSRSLPLWALVSEFSGIVSFVILRVPSHVIRFKSHGLKHDNSILCSNHCCPYILRLIGNEKERHGLSTGDMLGFSSTGSSGSNGAQDRILTRTGTPKTQSSTISLLETSFMLP